MYVPLDVNFPDDDKILDVGLEGAGAYVMALCLAKRLMSDGRLKRAHFRRLGASDAVVEVLIASDLVRADGPDVLVITAWLDHNASVTEIEERRSTDAQRKRVSRRKRPAGLQTDGADASENVQPLEVEVEREVEVEVENPPSPAEPGTALALVAAPLSPATPTAAAYPDAFDAWWKQYPRKVGKQAALAAWHRARRKAGSADRLATALAAHSDAWRTAGTSEQYIPHPATWLNEGRYDDPPPAAHAAARPGRVSTNQQRIAASLARAEGRQA